MAWPLLSAQWHSHAFSVHVARRQLQRHAVHAAAKAAKQGQKGAGKSKGGRTNGSDAGRAGTSQNAAAAKKGKVAFMQECKRDETLMFQPVKAGKDALHVCYAYPNDYNVGITSLGYQLVWAFFETRPDVEVTRLFTDAHDPLPQRIDLLGFSFSWELDYANLLTQLEQLGIPTNSHERTADHPLVFGGGPVLTANPEPYAAWFDVVLLGDGEDLLASFLQAYSAASSARAPGAGSDGAAGSCSRQDLLLALAQVPGVYVPSLYEPEYESPTGPLVAVRPVAAGVPALVTKQTYRGNMLASSAVVSPRMAWENIFMVEVVRSCPEMCRFCMASYLTLPFRAAPVEGALIPALQRGLAATDRVGLLGASVTQHPDFEALLAWLAAPDRAHIRMSIASVRTNTVTPQLAATLAARGTKSLTVAVESGSERVRRIINKKLAQDDIIACAVNAQEGGLSALKLYGMVGLPGEEEADVAATIDMMKTLRRAAPKLRLTLGCSTFVPKSHTPFQWFGVRKEADKRLVLLDKALAKEGVQFRPESYKWSIVQALLSRGDRRLTPLLIAVRGFGDTLGSYKRAFKAAAGQLPPLEHYAHADFAPGEAALPWCHLQGPLPEATLVKHAHEAVSLFDS